MTVQQSEEGGGGVAILSLRNIPLRGTACEVKYRGVVSSSQSSFWGPNGEMQKLSHRKSLCKRRENDLRPSLVKMPLLKLHTHQLHDSRSRPSVNWQNTHRILFRRPVFGKKSHFSHQFSYGVFKDDKEKLPYSFRLSHLDAFNS